MSNGKKHVVFAVKQFKCELYYATVEKITPKNLFLDYRSGEYHETRVKKSKIDYKLFDTADEARAFMASIRRNSTHDLWREHHKLAETYKAQYRSFMQTYLRTFNDWDEVDELRFCKHPRQIETVSESNPELNSTRCRDCGSVL